MQDTLVMLPWHNPNWLPTISAWITAQLDHHSIRITGPISQPHERPWATVLQIPTSAGTYFCKAVTPLLAHEVVLSAALATWHPSKTLPPLAIERKQHWMLMPSGGTQLREIIRADRDLGHWEALLPRYAEMQIAMAAREQELLALGLPDRRLSTLNTAYQHLLNKHAALPIDQPDRLSAAELQQLRDHISRLTTRCEQLGAVGIPASLHHGDLHDGNILVEQQQYRFFDWGDSCLAHPFVSLRTVFVSIEFSLGLAEDAPEFERLRQAYLEPWATGRSSAELRTALTLAEPIAAICGALGWDRVISGIATPLQAAYTAPVPNLLREFLTTINQ
jgi:hypothetical protein